MWLAPYTRFVFIILLVSKKTDLASCYGIVGNSGKNGYCDTDTAHKNYYVFPSVLSDRIYNYYLVAHRKAVRGASLIRFRFALIFSYGKITQAVEDQHIK